MLGVLFLSVPLSAPAQWNGYASNPQHTAISTAAVPAQSLNAIRWSTPVDDSTPAGTIYRHYGSPLITAANTVLVPVRTSAGGYRIEAHHATAPNPNVAFWQLSTNYQTPPSDGGWVPSFAPTLTPSGALYYQGAGGTVFRVADPNASSVTPVQISFLPNYATNQAAYNSSVFISTPLTSDSAGNIYFGYETTGSVAASLPSGIARIATNGTATYLPANLASGVAGASGLRLGTNAAPALSIDGSTLYVALNGNGQYLAALNATTLQPKTHAALPLALGTIIDQSTASPTVGPNGDVYFGTWLGQTNNYRGALHHFSGDLLQAFDPASFGWDITPSIVPRQMVPQYHGMSDYLLMVKYNEYKNFGDGVNKLAILDPTTAQLDARLNRNVMKEVLTIDGVTPDSPDAQHPNAVREWCINTAAVDPLSQSILVNSEDGILYRWHLPSNTFTQSVELVADGVLEAYTPSAIGPDGTVYAINKGTLFAVGVPEPGSAALLAVGGLLLTQRRRPAGASAELVRK